LASKTVRVAVDWALDQAECQCVTATGLTNLVARFLLEKLRAQLVEQNVESSSWRIISFNGKTNGKYACRCQQAEM